MANYYHDATCVKLDLTKAFYWYEKAANAGNSYAQNSLGAIYNLDSLFKRDVKKALYWFEKSADAGNPYTMINLGDLYAEEKGLLNNSKADNWYKKAFFILNQKAKNGDLDAMEAVGSAYAEGQGIEQDTSKALYWWNKAADLGNSEAMTDLGHAYLAGDIVQMDYTKAIFWFTKAAEAGDQIAMYYLGQASEVGANIKQDYSKAFYWFAKSAEGGGRNAVYELAKLYDAGIGVKRDIEKAQHYYQKACGFNITAACVFNDQIIKQKERDKLLNATTDAGIKWHSYQNPLSLYQIRVPDFLVLQEKDSINKQVFVAEDGGKLMISQLDHDWILKDRVIHFLEETHPEGDMKITYSLYRDNLIVLSGTIGQDIFYSKVLIDDSKNAVIFELVYPKSLQQKYDKIIKTLASSFKKIPINIVD